MSDIKARPILHEAIQSTTSTDSDLDGAILLGWITVAEWMAPSGDRWLSRVDGNATGGGLPEWTREGLLHNALYSGGFGASRELEEDEEED